MNHEEVDSKILEIMSMDTQELLDFNIKLSMSKVDAKAKRFLLIAVQLRTQELSTTPQHLVEHGELREGEL